MWQSDRFARALGCLCAMVVLVATGCSHDESSTTKNASGEKRIILLTNGNSPYWDAARSGLAEADEKLNLKASGLKAVMEVNDGTPAGQINMLRQFGSQGDVSGVAVSALDANNAAVADELRSLRKKGIHVITVDADVDRDKFRDAREYYVGTDNFAGGRALGLCAKGLRPDGGPYVFFVGRTGAQNAIERMSGFKDAAGEKFVEKDRMADDLDRTKARDNVRNAILNFPDLTTLVGIWSYNAPAIVDVVKEKNKTDLTVVTFDAEKLAISQMGEGYIQAMVVQNPYNIGYQAVRILKALATKDDATVNEMFPSADKKAGADADVYDTGLKVVVPDSKSPLKKDLFGEKVEYLTLPEFKTWLAKYNLESS